jgi:predicted methyltransferase
MRFDTMRTLSPAILALALLMSAGHASATAPAEAPSSASRQAIEAAVAAPHRTPAFAARDQYRNPVETLAFFGITPHMTVVEIWPGGGWYTEILAPLLREHGRYYAAAFAIDDLSADQYRARIMRNFLSKLNEGGSLYDKVNITRAGPDEAIAPAGSAGAVLTFRNVHNWINEGSAEAMFSAFHEALSEGGILGVVEHRAPVGTSDAEMKRSGYVTEARVIALAEAAGFELVDRSQINANPLDTADHPEGVWTLPPSLRLGDTDREKYLAIGESDRMTLKFIKR